MSKYRIDTIEEMTEDDIRVHFAPNFEAVPVKGYTVYLLDFEDAFGYSMIVFGDGRQIIWANDYEMHHSGQSREELRRMYLDRAESVLFTEQELAEPLKSYDDFQRRRKFITELLPLKRDFMSWFHIDRTPEEKAARKLDEAKHPVVCMPAMGFFTEEDAGFGDYVSGLYLALMEQEQDVANNYEYQKNAFYYELGNHEYHINTYQGDWDTLSAFGQIPWRGQGAEARKQYFDDLGFTETQRMAFEDARKQFLRDAGEHDWY